MKILSKVLIALFVISAYSTKVDYSSAASWEVDCTVAARHSPVTIDPSDKICENTQVFELNFIKQTALLQWVDSSMLKTGGDIKFATLKAENLKGEVIEYDATYIAIHSKAEHQFGSTRNDLEMQIYFKNNKAQYAAVAFLFSAGSKTSLLKPLFDILPKVPYITDSFQYKTIDLGSMFGDKLKEAPFSRYYYYEGTQTYPPCAGPVTWYVMEQVYYIDANQLALAQAPINFVVGTQGNRKPDVTLSSTSVQDYKRGGCYPGYWRHDMGSNIGVFYMIPFMIIFFAGTLIWETEFEHKAMMKQKNNPFTCHLIYSLFAAASEEPFSRNARSTLLMATMVTQMAGIAAFMHFYTENADQVWMWFAYAVPVVFASKIWQWFLGLFLYLNYGEDGHCSKWLHAKKADKMPHFLSMQNYDFYFYFLCFFTVVAGWILNNGFLYGKSQDHGMAWLVSIHFGFFLDWTIFEGFYLVVASNGGKNCCKKRGTYFEYKIYQKYYDTKLK